MNQQEIYKSFQNLLHRSGITEEEFMAIARHSEVDTLQELISLALKVAEEDKKLAPYRPIMKLLKDNNGILTSSELKAHNVQSYQIKTLENMGKIVRLKRGLYALADMKYALDEMVEASLLVSGGVLCLYSALAHHELSTFTPGEYTIAIPRNERRPVLPDYPPIHIYVFDRNTFQMGMEEVERQGRKIKVYNRERTICDIVKYRNKLDANVVKEALNHYSGGKAKNYARLMEYAEALRVRTVLTKYLEVL